MMTTPAISASLLAESLAEYQLTGQLLRNTEPNGSGELFVPPPPDSSLWTNGLPDPIKIKNKMDQTIYRFVNYVYPPLEDGPFHYIRLIRQRKEVQSEFYATMAYYESLLAPSVTPVSTESTTSVVPYQPPAKRGRGRPSSGGRKPKPTTRRGRRKEFD